jgi:hypothetical protein
MMPNCSFVFVLCLIFFSNTVQAKSLVYTERGQSASGNRTYQYYQLGGDGLFEWQSSSEGSPFCPSVAGQFQATIAEQELKTIFQQAEKVYKEQLPHQPKDASELDRSVVAFFLSLNEAGEKSRTVAIEAEGKETLPFKNSLAALKKSSAPVSAVKMSLKRNKKSLEVIFKLLGTRSFPLYFGKNSGEQFISGETKFVIVNPPKHGLTFLTPEAPQLKLQLKLPASPVTEIYFHNAIPVEELDKENRDKLKFHTPQNISLCAE